MAVVSRVATIVLSGATGSRSFVATAAVENTAAGGSVVVTVTNGTTGAVPPAAPDTFTLEFRDDASALIKTVGLNATAASQSDTFFFTANGLSGGAARCGTVEIVLRATKTTGGPTATYDVETDGAPNTPPTGFSTTQLDRGWIRGSTEVVEAVSNIALGGGKNTPAEYDESLFVRTTLGAVSYVARTLTVASSVGGLSGATNSSTAVTRDVTFTGVVDNRFAAASTVVSWTVTASNATLTGQPFTTFTTVTDDTITVDPRLTCAHLLQIDDNAFGTPPLTKNSATGQRRTSSIGYLSTGIRAARGTVVGTAMSRGVNGLTVSTSLQDAAQATTAITQSEVTATKGSETGWVQALMQWTSALPGGTWNKTTSVTAPADITGAAYLLNSTVAYTLLAVDPAIRVFLAARPTQTNRSDHFSPGDDLYVSFSLFNTESALLLDPQDAVVMLVRAVSGVGQFLRASDSTWQPIGAGAIDSFSLTASPSDVSLFERTFTGTSGWDTYDFTVIGRGRVGGTPYSDIVVVPVVSDAANAHSGFVLDAVGLALSGALGFK